MIRKKKLLCMLLVLTTLFSAFSSGIAAAATQEASGTVTIEFWDGTEEVKDVNIGDELTVTVFLTLPDELKLCSIDIHESFDSGDDILDFVYDTSDDSTDYSEMFPVIDDEMIANVDGNVFRTNASYRKWNEAKEFPDGSVLAKTKYRVVAEGDAAIKLDILELATVNQADALEPQFESNIKIGSGDVSFDYLVEQEIAPHLVQELAPYHSITVEGDVNLNYFMNPDLVETGDTVHFTWDNGLYDYELKAADYVDGYGFKAPIELPAAEMTYDVKISVDGILQTDTYSVRNYCDVVLSDSYKNNYVTPDGKPLQTYDNLEALVKAMLDYGAKAQTVFEVKTSDLANKDISVSNDPIVWESVPDTDLHNYIDYMYSNFGLKYEGTSLIYLEKTTLRHYFTVVDDEKYNNIKSSIMMGNETIGYRTITPVKRSTYICFDYTGIAAAELDDQYDIKINGTYCGKYGALNYCAISSYFPLSTDEEKELSAATYRYNAAANAYFG